MVETLNLEKAMKKYEKLEELSIDTILDIHRTITNLVFEKEEWSGILRDGNGRTSRIIQNALLENIDMPRLIIRPQDKQYYYKALEDATVYGDRKGWIKFSLNYTLFMCINGRDFIKDIR